MNDIVGKLKEIYIDRITKTLSIEKTVAYFLFLLCQIYLVKSPKIGFTKFLYYTKINDLLDVNNGILSEITIGSIFLSFILSCINTWAYNRIIKKSFFSYLSKAKGFENTIKTWIERSQLRRSYDTSLNTEFAKDIREEINLKILKVAQIHSFGEIAFSCFSILVFLFKRNENIDFLFLAITALFILWIQRHSYVYYLSEVLPRIVTEKVFLEEGIDHKKAFLDTV